MRKEPFTVGSFVHVYNRGNRKQPIVLDERDKWHFLEMLYYFNSEFSQSNPFRAIRKVSQDPSGKDLLRINLNRPSGPFVWPEDWPKRKPIVKILAFVLMKNHFHLCLKEIQDGGITLFMRRLGTGMASHYNIKYREVGRLFQNSYKAKRIDDEQYLKYLSVYIQVKNTFELYPKGLAVATRKFNEAYKWAVRYSYCSLADYSGHRDSPIIDKDVLGELFPDPEKYKIFAEQCLARGSLEESIGTLAIDE